MPSSLSDTDEGKQKMIRRTDKYQITWTKDHFINVSCKEINCEQFINGWVTNVPINSPQEQYIRNDKTRKAVGVKVDAGTMSYLFQEGQRCFRDHKVKLDKAPFFTVNQPGRETARLKRSNMNFDRWTDRFNEQSYQSFRR